ncbi:hypothetical protein GCM10028774_06580 [Spirosoma jeollabukense]
MNAKNNRKCNELKSITSVTGKKKDYKGITILSGKQIWLHTDHKVIGCFFDTNIGVERVY